MRVTSVRIQASREPGDVAAYVSIVLDHSLVVRRIRVVRGATGRVYISMPSHPASSGTWEDAVYAVNSRLREDIKRTILEHYRTWPELLGTK